MNRAQFTALLVGSALVVLLFFLQALLAAEARSGQGRVAAAEQVITEGNECHVRAQALATRIYQVSVQTQDQALRDILDRQHIPLPSGSNSSAGVAPETGSPTTR